MIQPILFVHPRALSTVSAYHDLVPSMLSEQPPVEGLVLSRAKRDNPTVSWEQPGATVEVSRFRFAGSSRSRPRSKSTKQPPWRY